MSGAFTRIWASRFAKARPPVDRTNAVDAPAAPAELTTAVWAAHQDRADSAKLRAMVTGLPRLVSQGMTLAWSASRAGTVTVIVANVVAGLCGAYGLLTMTRVLRYLVLAGSVTEHIRQAVPDLIVLAVCASAAGGSRNLSTWAVARIGPRIDRLVGLRFASLATKVELTAFDDPDFHDALHRARERGIYDASRVVTAVFTMFGSLVGVISAISALALLHPLLLVVLIAAMIPNGWAKARAAKIRYAVMYSLSESRRRKWLLLDLMAGQAAAAELRSFAMRDFLISQYDAVATHVQDDQLRTANRQTVVQTGGDIVSALGVCLVYASLIGLLAAGFLPLAVAGGAVFAIRSGQSSLTGILMAMNNCYESGLYLEDFFAFCDLAKARAIPPPDDSPLPDFDTLAVENVSFTYHGADEPAIVDVSLNIRRGETIALVGENGSGKTTLAKLLAGLYRPCAGDISWNGASILSMSPENLRSKTAVVAQDFISWPFSVRHNVSMCDQVDEQALFGACAASGADDIVRRLPEGYATILDRRFVGGHDLSGGQWQRIALARGFYRDLPLLICDEPTSALDAHAEERVFQTIRSLAEKRTTVLITHRLVNVMYADRIYVLDRGRIVESGTHESLLATGRRYREMFTLQARAYRQPGGVSD